MKPYQDETVQMLSLARVLAEKIAKVRGRHPDVAARLDVLRKAALERAAYAEAGWAPPPWPSIKDRPLRNSYARGGTFGLASGGLAMFGGLDFDYRKISFGMIGR